MKTLLQQTNKRTTRKNIFNLLVVSIIASFVLYGFAIASTTLSIADANTHNRDINELQTEIAELEIEYFEIVNTLSLEEAQEEGFQEVSNIHYARIDDRKSVAYNL
jgi:hypothetical protein